MPHSFTPTMPSSAPRLGFNLSRTCANPGVVPALLYCEEEEEKKTIMSSTFFPFPLFPFGTSTSQKISTPHRARHKRCCNTLSGSVPINDNFGKHCLNNSSQEKKLLDEMILLGLPAQTYMCSQAASPAGRQLEVIGMAPKSLG